jgi:hypothetical protein
MNKELIKRLTFRVPAALKRRWIADTEERVCRVRAALDTYYLRDSRPPAISQGRYDKELRDHLFFRRDQDRMKIVPWLTTQCH